MVGIYGKNKAARNMRSKIESVRHMERVNQVIQRSFHINCFVGTTRTYYY